MRDSNYIGSVGGNTGNAPPRNGKIIVEKYGISEGNSFRITFPNTIQNAKLKIQFNRKFKVSIEFLSKIFNIFAKFPNNLYLASKRAKSQHRVFTILLENRLKIMHLCYFLKKVLKIFKMFSKNAQTIVCRQNAR